MKRPPARMSVCAGFTLLEIVVFLTIAGIVLPLIIAPFVTAVTRSEDPEIVLAANFLASQRYESLLGAGYFSLPTAAQSETITLNSQTFTRTTSAAVEVDGNDLTTPLSGSGIKRVTITVTHTQNLPGGLAITGLVSNRL